MGPPHPAWGRGAGARGRRGSDRGQIAEVGPPHPAWGRGAGERGRRGSGRGQIAEVGPPHPAWGRGAGARGRRGSGRGRSSRWVPRTPRGVVETERGVGGGLVGADRRGGSPAPRVGAWSRREG